MFRLYQALSPAGRGRAAAVLQSFLHCRHRFLILQFSVAAHQLLEAGWRQSRQAGVTASEAEEAGSRGRREAGHAGHHTSEAGRQTGGGRSWHARRGTWHRPWSSSGLSDTELDL